MISKKSHKNKQKNVSEIYLRLFLAVNQVIVHHIKLSEPISVDIKGISKTRAQAPGIVIRYSQKDHSCIQVHDPIKPGNQNKNKISIE